MIRLIDENGERLVTQSEYDLIMASKYVWSKEAHIAEINQLHDELFKSILSANNYIDMAELTMWTMQPDSQYRIEANEIKQWYIDTFTLIEQYEATVTEQTKVDPIQFINNLPTYGE